MDLWAICYNRADKNAGARSFTLLHEFAHVSIGSSGISDHSITHNEVERYCNQVAAKALAPGRLLKTLLGQNPHQIADYSSYIGYFANKLGTSKHMIAIRLIEIGVSTQKQLKEWQSSFLNDYGYEKADGGGPPDRPIPEGVKKIAQYGTYLPLLLSEAIERGAIKKSEIQVKIGIRSKYIDSTISAARERTQSYIAS